MSNLLKRILTGVIAGGAVVGGIWADAWGMFVFGLLVSVLGQFEFYKIAGPKSKLAKWFLLLMSGCMWVYSAIFIMFPINDKQVVYTIMLETNWLPFFILISGLTAILLLFEKRVHQPAREMSLLVFGYLYAFVPIFMLFILSLNLIDAEVSLSFMQVSFERASGYNFEIPLGILFLTWVLDSMAYFGGRFLGRTKLWERISPKKTWEGTVIGAAACMGLAFGFESWWPQSWSWLVVGAIIAVFSQLGDLVESMFKRGLKIKDSGGILPGHGGILDRFDGMYVSIPVIYVYILSHLLLSGH